MPESTPTTQNEEVKKVSPPLNTLHPSKIDLKKITDKDEYQIAEKMIQDWYEAVDKEVSDLLQKHGVDVFALGIRQNGMKTGMIFARGDLLNIAKLASQASRYLRKQVDAEIGEDERP